MRVDGMEGGLILYLRRDGNVQDRADDRRMA